MGLNTVIFIYFDDRIQLGQQVLIACKFFKKKPYNFPWFESDNRTKHPQLSLAAQPQV